MTIELKEHLARFIRISDEEYEDVLQYFQAMTVGRKENLLEDGQVCKWNYFVTKGLLRKFFINEKGVEQTTQFALEGWWMTDDMSFQNHRPSSFFIQAVDPAEGR